MPTLTEKDIRARIDAWAEYERAIAAIAERAGPIEKEIRDWFETHGRAMRITGNEAFAELFIDKKFGSRKIDLQSFLAATEDCDERDVHECLTVSVAKAEKLLGETALNKISERRVSESKRFRLELSG